MPRRHAAPPRGTPTPHLRTVHLATAPLHRTSAPHSASCVTPQAPLTVYSIEDEETGTKHLVSDAPEIEIKLLKKARGKRAAPAEGAVLGSRRRQASEVAC